ncbi:MAG: cytochrome c [Verrucomicrobiales bacterium]|nr:cytochrome c [Verrucomicrobiales bacterium]
MKMHYLTLAIALPVFLAGCGSRKEANEAAKNAPTPAELISGQPIVHGPEIKNVEVKNPLDQAWVAGGKGIFDSKCMPCHKLDGTKLVGPGWAGVTKRRTPVWIMNMICNTDYMLANDPDAQKQLELCLIRMPNQNVSVEDARKILEFMRSNDGEK